MREDESAVDESPLTSHHHSPSLDTATFRPVATDPNSSLEGDATANTTQQEVVAAFDVPVDDA